MKKNLTILAIETSCDDTGVAIVKIFNEKKLKFKVLANIVSSQIEIHRKYGGVYPMMAKREHQRNLIPVLMAALERAKLLKTQSAKRKAPARLASQRETGRQNYNLKFKTLIEILSRDNYLLKSLSVFLKKYSKPNVNAIAVTVGPGLEPSLWVGVNFAKALSYLWGVPIVPVNHIEGHILVNFLPKINEISNYQLPISKKIPNSNFQISKKLFPAICLVVSGGHTQLILMKDFGKYKILGETKDDAAGECFDKTARILGLGYPGGPVIAAIAAKTKNQKSKIKNKLPRPMINTKDYDFSFSGLKTAVLYQVKNEKRKAKNINYIQAMATEIQQAIIDVLIKKTIKAAKNFKAKTIILGGGVAANKELRKQFAEKIKKQIPNTQYLAPNTQLCTDNALMAAVAGYFKTLYNHTLAKKGSERSEGSYFRLKRGETEEWKDIEVNANLRVE